MIGGSAGVAYCIWRLCSDWRAVSCACCHALGRSPLEQSTKALCSALLFGSHELQVMVIYEYARDREWDALRR
jgi:hypothetical protein